jgi:hypothetical protein
MSIFRHARLHKLFQFMRFGASILDHDMREERIFCQRRRRRKTLGEIERLRRDSHNQELE